MKWEQDLVTDIRIGDAELDDQDGPFSLDGRGWSSIDELEGVALAKEKFLSVRDHTRSILEIGVNQFGFTRTWLDNKNKGTTYIGIDIGDRSHLNNPSELTWTIKNSSSHVDDNMATINQLGVTSFDFIYIDGWHSINQVLLDWEYTNFLAPGGIVGFHDTNYHPGPKLFIAALDRDKWEVEDNTSATDWGVVFVRKL